VNWPGCPLGSEGDGLLALDGDGFVLGCNSMARQLVPQPLRTPGAPTHASDLLAMPWAMLFDAARRHPVQPIDLPLWSGLRLHALAQLPEHARGASQPANAMHPALAGVHPPAAPLREAETALIRQAVQDARGNVAEAARALGISRATVYRKLGHPKAQ
ncbi:MAG: helix-turn-helix domain-containing protein, partial [Burkholderiaceae bacterium]|nr:helix-turn-helix domain-containing protein [Burkholderiaceae bacterium]